jgi:hypothetical protein
VPDLKIGIYFHRNLQRIIAACARPDRRIKINPAWSYALRVSITTMSEHAAQANLPVCKSADFYRHSLLNRRYMCAVRRAVARFSSRTTIDKTKIARCENRHNTYRYIPVSPEHAVSKNALFAGALVQIEQTNRTAPGKLSARS